MVAEQPQSDLHQNHRRHDEKDREEDQSLTQDSSRPGPTPAAREDGRGALFYIPGPGASQRRPVAAARSQLASSLAGEGALDE